MSKKKIWIVALLVVLALLAGIAAAAFFGYARPYTQAANAMPGGQLQLQALDDGKISLTWPAGENAQGYLIRVLEPSAGTEFEGNVLFSLPVENDTQCVLEGIPLDREVEIRVDSYRDYRVLFSEGSRRRMGDNGISVRGLFQAPAVSGLTWEMDEETDLLTVDFTLPENGQCRVYHSEGGEPQLLQTLTEGHLEIPFGENGMFPVPEREDKHIFTFDVVCTFEDYVYTGVITEELIVTREGMLGTELNAQWTAEGNNVYSVTWDETKGAYYAVEQFDEAAQQWIELGQVQPGEERTFTTGPLPRYSEIRLRVVAVGGQTLPDSAYAAISEEYTASTGASVIYSTIWPIQDLKVYSDTAKTKSLGTAPGGQAYCVLDIADGMFQIRFGDALGYIDSNYCLINLPEMIGDICSYNITNSFSSIYKVHDFDLPNVTGKVIGGYENVKQSDGSYLAPLLYPVALKLEKAAFKAQEEGYRLKIYDSYRPQEATQFLYDQASGIADDPIPDQQPQEDPTQPLVTYQQFMTDNYRYPLNYFLAKGASKHNQGIAVDLTIEKLSSREEMQMQTAMHDLTWYSELDRNNANAKKLRSIMLSADFAGLVSEWWHFQDNDARYNLKPAHLWKGVTAECWMADDNGWRYRGATGKYVADTTRTIGGVEYTFDANGYVVNE